MNKEELIDELLSWDDDISTNVKSVEFDVETETLIIHLN